MSDMTIKIGAFDKDARTVPVTFIAGDVRHERNVNAVLKDDGTYDKAATKARVDDVARGVAHKIGLGVIAVPLPEPEMPVPDAPAS